MSDVKVHRALRGTAQSWTIGWLGALLALPWRELGELLVVLKGLLDKQHGE